MATEAELFREGNYRELWQRCCGFIDLRLEEFMEIQRHLLFEQLELLGNCDLGNYILNGVTPLTVDEFRQQVPLTTYDDYAPYLLEKREDVLPDKPALWQYTSGKSGEYDYRWVPVTSAQLREVKSLLFAMLFFSGCSERGEVSLKEGDRVFYGVAPPPYATGTMVRAFLTDVLNFLPPIDEAEHISFEERIRRGFEMALSNGLDACFALSSVAVAIGDRFQKKSSDSRLLDWLRRPRALARLARGLIKSKLARRPMLPRDLWKLKGLITFGIDSSIFREKITEMWGRVPLEFHGCTEAILIAMQTWDHQGMTFIPYLNYFEFIPEEESLKSRRDPSYQPRTLLMNELTPGNYELVITSLHGGPFIRYRLGHLIEIISLRNERLDIDIPQMKFLTRVDDQIDIAGFTRLSEKIIWQAIENSGLEYAGWSARKEVNGGPLLHLYIELNENGITQEEAAETIHEELKKLDTPYAELESITGLRPLKVTLLPANAFHRYRQRQETSGADLQQLQAPHVNPGEDTIDFLIGDSNDVSIRTN